MRAHLSLVRLWVCVVLISLVTALSANAEDSPLAAPGAYLQNIPAKESEAGKFDARKLQALVMAMADDYVARCCQTNANQSPKSPTTPSSCRQLTPLGQRGGAVLLEDGAAVQMTVEVEVIVD